MQIIHISDTHGSNGHLPLSIPTTDVLIHSGDIGGRTNLYELQDFLEWFSAQPAKLKILVPGNHDIITDPRWSIKLQMNGNAIGALLEQQHHRDAASLIESYKDITYLCNDECTYEGIKFYGSPYSPSFYRDSWVWNADRGDEIKKHWAKIPTDVDVLITHTPAYSIMDEIPEKFKRYPDEDVHVGCKDLLDVITRRLHKLSLHCFGHIHAQYGVQLIPISNRHNVLFSNGAVLDNDYKLVITKPLTITI